MKPNILTAIKKYALLLIVIICRASISRDLTLCYYALKYFLDKDVSYTSLTNLVLITREILADVQSIIPSSIDSLLILLIQKICGGNFNRELSAMSVSKERILLIESLYGCLLVLIKRCKLFP